VTSEEKHMLRELEGSLKLGAREFKVQRDRLLCYLHSFRSLPEQELCEMFQLNKRTIKTILKKKNTLLSDPKEMSADF
jgi:hypothetical protein